MHEFKRLEQSLDAMGIACTKAQLSLFERYHAMLLDWNTRMDLTAVLTTAEMIDRHYVDSASPLAYGMIPPNAQIIDVGTGAGFPGIPLAILRGDVQVTLLDALQKRCAFLQAVVTELSLPCTVLHKRAEDAGRDATLREGFDVVVSRAVAPLPTLLEYTLPLAKVGGKTLAWKGPAVLDEMEAGRRAAFLLGGELAPLQRVQIPGQEAWQHQLLCCEKSKKTPGIYPRKAGLPKKSPLA